MWLMGKIQSFVSLAQVTCTLRLALVYTCLRITRLKAVGKTSAFYLYYVTDLFKLEIRHFCFTSVVTYNVYSL